MTSFFAELALTGEGYSCFDVDGFMHLSTAQECKDAVSYAKSFNSNARYHSEVSKSSFPKGCIIIIDRTNLSGYMWFNSHPTGGGICPFTETFAEEVMSNFECNTKQKENICYYQPHHLFIFRS